MPTLAVNQIYAFRMFSGCKDQIGLNVLHYLITAVSPTPPSASAFFDNLDSAFSFALKPLLSAEASYVGSAVQCIFPTAFQPDINQSRAGVGTGGAQVLPKQVSFVVTKKTGLAGRKNRGRMYIPFPSEFDNDTFGAPNPGYVNAVNTLCVAIFSDQIFASCTAKPVIYRRSAPAASPIVTQYRLNGRWGTQRRRGDYGRVNNLIPS